MAEYDEILRASWIWALTYADIEPIAGYRCRQLCHMPDIDVVILHYRGGCVSTTKPVVRLRRNRSHGQIILASALNDGAIFRID